MNVHREAANSRVIEVLCHCNTVNELSAAWYTSVSIHLQQALNAKILMITCTLYRATVVQSPYMHVECQVSMCYVIEAE